MVLGAAAAALGLWFVSRRLDLAAAPGQLARAPVWALASALGLLALNLALYAIRWRVLLGAAGSAVPARRLLPAILLANGANTVLPARGGDLLRVESVRERFGVRPAHAVGTLFLERLLDGVVLATFLAAAVLSLGLPGAAVAASLVLLGAVALGVVVTLAAALRPARAALLLGLATARLPSWVRTPAERSLSGFLAGLSAFARPSALARAVALSFAMWLPQVAIYLLIGRGFGLDLSPAGYLLIASLANVALALPLAPAGLGSYEAAVLFGATGFAAGAGSGAVAAYLVAMRGILFLPVLAGGAAALPRSLPSVFGRRVPQPPGRRPPVGAEGSAPASGSAPSLDLAA